MARTIIHVNRHRVLANCKNGTDEPVITVKSGKTNRYCHEVEIKGPSKVVYTPNKPLSCGAKVYIVVADGIDVELTMRTQQ